MATHHHNTTKTILNQVVPLGALAAGFGLASLASAQVPASASAPAQAASTPASPTDAAAGEATLRKITVKGRQEESGRNTLQPTTTRIGKGTQELRDVPQSVTVVTEKLLLDRNQDTLKDALHNTAGITFQAAEGGEEDIRLRGFSLQSTGDIFIDGMRDPAFYERDAFNWDRLEVLRGSASMLFGRGSTGGAVNQVSKLPGLVTRSEVNVTMGSGDYLRGSADFNVVTGEDAALRITAMNTQATNNGAGASIDKQGIAPTYSWGIGTANEFTASFYYLQNNSGINYGLPWLTPGPVRGGNYLWPTDPKNYYGMASDYTASGVSYGGLSHTHRFVGGGELKTSARYGVYNRDQRASAVRFAVPTTSDTFNDATLLRRSNGNGVQAKIMNMETLYAQSDYSGKFGWFGLNHAVQGGIDFAHERFENRALAPNSPTLIKPDTTVGGPSNPAGVDETSRVTRTQRTFDAKAVGVYAQDLLQLAPAWKVLGGLRWDRFDGSYGQPQLLNAAGGVAQVGAVRARVDSLWSKRFGLLFQPTPLASFHFSYGTSFNTSGDTYQYDEGSVKADPESSRNIELGAKLDHSSGRATLRLALFHSTKYNERNRDDQSVTATNYVLSGKRHAAGVEVDLAGRITPAWEVFGSYAFIPDAKVDQGTPQALQQNGEAVGERPGLTPRHTGTLWTTYQLLPAWRLGGGLNARSSDKPVGLAAGSAIRAPRFVTADLMAEYTLNQDLAFKLNLTNVANKHYADMLYRGHYIPGKGRTLQLTGTYKF